MKLFNTKDSHPVLSNHSIMRETIQDKFFDVFCVTETEIPRQEFPIRRDCCHTRQQVKNFPQPLQFWRDFYSLGGIPTFLPNDLVDMKS